MSLQLEQVSKRVKTYTHIYPTTLELQPQNFNVLLGPTNSGKTTLIKLLAGLEKPSTGRILFNGKDVTSQSPQQRNIALVHQFFINYPHLTVYENIASPLRVTGVADDEIRREVHKLAELLQLEPMLKRHPAELSGGQQQRTALARALAKPATAVFLDEPLANLDYKLREELRDQLPSLFAERNTVVVYATSEPSEALLLGGNTALVHAGKISQFGPTSTIYRQPSSLTAAQVFSDPPINIATTRKQGNKMSIGANLRWQLADSLTGMDDGEYTIGVRPYHVLPQQKSTGSLEIDCEILVTELSGSSSVAHFEIDGSNWSSLATGTHPFVVGEQCKFYMHPDEFMYFDAHGTVIQQAGAHG